MSFITTKFHEILFQRFQRICADKLFRSVVSFILAKFLCSKRALLREKKLNQNFLWICASTRYVLYNYKVSENSVERFQRSCADKKNRTDGVTDRVTDWRVKNIIPSATRCVGYKNVYYLVETVVPGYVSVQHKGQMNWTTPMMRTISLILILSHVT